MSQPTKVPIIVGVGEIKNASRKREDAVEPLHLMIQAIQVAAQDADAAGAGPGKSKSKVIEQIQSVAVIASSTWPYNDLPSRSYLFGNGNKPVPYEIQCPGG